MIPCHTNSGGEKDAMISVISENFNYDVNTEMIYQTFKMLKNYFATSSSLFQIASFPGCPRKWSVPLFTQLQQLKT